MIKGRKVYDPLTDTWSTGYWIADDKGNYYPVWQERSGNDDISFLYHIYYRYIFCNDWGL